MTNTPDESKTRARTASDARSFWATLPGILTGIATVLTALVGLINVLHKSEPSAPARAPAQVTPPATAPVTTAMTTPVTAPDAETVSTPASSQKPAAIKPIGCDNALGNWDWDVVGGVVTFEQEGRLLWRARATDAAPTASGTWRCIDPDLHQMTLFWPVTGITDTLYVSDDGKSISGTNNVGMKVSGSKR
jgi:hypothetical protein